MDDIGQSVTVLGKRLFSTEEKDKSEQQATVVVTLDGYQKSRGLRHCRNTNRMGLRTRLTVPQ